MIFGILLSEPWVTLVVIFFVLFSVLLKFFIKVVRAIKQNLDLPNESNVEVEKNFRDDFEDDFVEAGSMESRVVEKKNGYKRPEKSGEVSPMMKEEAKDEGVKIDLSDKDEVRKAVIMSEIFNRKY